MVSQELCFFSSTVLLWVKVINLFWSRSCKHLFEFNLKFSVKERNNKHRDNPDLSETKSLKIPLSRFRQHSLVLIRGFMKNKVWRRIYMICRFFITKTSENMTLPWWESRFPWFLCSFFVFGFLGCENGVWPRFIQILLCQKWWFSDKAIFESANNSLVSCKYSLTLLANIFCFSILDALALCACIPCAYNLCAYVWAYIQAYSNMNGFCAYSLKDPIEDDCIVLQVHQYECISSSSRIMSINIRIWSAVIICDWKRSDFVRLSACIWAYVSAALLFAMQSENEIVSLICAAQVFAVLL